MSLNKRNYDEFLKYLKTDEWKSIFLSSRLREKKNYKLRSIANGQVWLKQEKGIINGVIFLSRHGLMIPRFKPEVLDEQSSYILSKFIKVRRHRIFDIIGMAGCVRYIEQFLDTKPNVEKNYRMLIHSLINLSPETRIPSIAIRPAGTEDFHALWPLQKAYLLEEVYQENHQLDDFLAKRQFANSLKSQLVYMASLHNKPVGKVQTNARGWVYDQIGGVYVFPEYRNQGLGESLMNRILHVIAKENHCSSLFVKTSNKAALRLYEKLGYRDEGEFRSSHWVP